MSDRYIVRTQDDYFNVTDTYNNVPIVNGIRTEIEAEWLCNTLNELEGENKVLKKGNRYFYDEHKRVVDEYQNKIKKLENENQELKQENKKIIDTINNKITQLGMDWYGAEDDSKEEKEANLQLNVLEEVRDELKEKLN